MCYPDNSLIPFIIHYHSSIDQPIIAPKTIPAILSREVFKTYCDIQPTKAADNVIKI